MPPHLLRRLQEFFDVFDQFGELHIDSQVQLIHYSEKPGDAVSRESGGCQ
jgi:hypothetical protein